MIYFKKAYRTNLFLSKMLKGVPYMPNKSVLKYPYVPRKNEKNVKDRCIVIYALFILKQNIGYKLMLFHKKEISKIRNLPPTSNFLDLIKCMFMIKIRY